MLSIAFHMCVGVCLGEGVCVCASLCLSNLAYGKRDIFPSRQTALYIDIHQCAPAILARCSLSALSNRPSNNQAVQGGLKQGRGSEQAEHTFDLIIGNLHRTDRPDQII